MSLRNSLKAAVGAKVACCVPLEMQPATAGEAGVTDDATAVQQLPGKPRNPWVQPATTTATSVQLGSCIGGGNPSHVATQKLHGPAQESPELQVALTTTCNTQPGPLTRHRLGTALVQAIHRCCDARGDEPENRAALLEECADLLPEQQADLLAHFSIEAIRWEATARGLKP